MCTYGTHQQGHLATWCQCATTRDSQRSLRIGVSVSAVINRLLSKITFLMRERQDTRGLHADPSVWACFNQIYCFCASLPSLLQYGTKAREFYESLGPHSPLSAGGLAAEYSGRANQALLGLVQKMVVLDPESRPSAAELLQDPVFAGLRNISQISKDNQQLVAESVSKSLEILKVRLRAWREPPGDEQPAVVPHLSEED